MKLKYIGPIYDTWNFHLIALTGDAIIVFKLGFESVLINALNQSLPFFYSNHFEKMLKYPLGVLKSKFNYDTIPRSDIECIEIKRNNHLAHEIMIQTTNKPLRFKIQWRNRVDEYEIIVNEWTATSH